MACLSPIHCDRHTIPHFTINLTGSCVKCSLGKASPTSQADWVNSKPAFGLRGSARPERWVGCATRKFNNQSKALKNISGKCFRSVLGIFAFCACVQMQVIPKAESNISRVSSLAHTFLYAQKWFCMLWRLRPIIMISARNSGFQGCSVLDGLEMREYDSICGHEHETMLNLSAGVNEGKDQKQSFGDGDRL
jgi:hypothetical protein